MMAGILGYNSQLPTAYGSTYNGVLPNFDNGVSLNIPQSNLQGILSSYNTQTPTGIPSLTAAANLGNQDSNFLGLSQNGWGNLGQGIMGAFNIYSGLQANKLAKQQLAFAKQQYSTNLANSIKSYNTQLADKINSRYAVEGKSSADAAAYLEANKL